MRHRREQCRVEPLRSARQPPGVATRTEVAALARAGEGYSCVQASQRMRAKPCSNTPHARNLSATCVTTGRHGPYSRSKRSLQTVCRRCRWSETNRNSGDACGRRGWWTPRAAGRRVEHRRFESEERRAYARFGRGPSPFRCATSRFDATSARYRPNDACCCRADR